MGLSFSSQPSSPAPANPVSAATHSPFVSSTNLHREIEAIEEQIANLHDKLFVAKATEAYAEFLKQARQVPGFAIYSRFNGDLSDDPRINYDFLCTNMGLNKIFYPGYDPRAVDSKPHTNPTVLTADDASLLARYAGEELDLSTPIYMSPEVRERFQDIAGRRWDRLPWLVIQPTTSDREVIAIETNPPLSVDVQPLNASMPHLEWSVKRWDESMNIQQLWFCDFAWRGEECLC